MPVTQSVPKLLPMTPQDVYEASNAAATKALYTRLEACGPAGIVALNLFRAQKASSRAKKYHGGIPGKGSYSHMAYEKKAWALGNLCRVLMDYWRDLRISWGWRRDPRESYAPWVLYIDLPGGQVSFQSTQRLTGPDYYGEWDGQHVSEQRVIDFCSEILRTQTKTPMLF